MIEGSLNQYRIIGSLGAGGMGEVYRARDTRLNREVAIKVLPEEFASDPDRLRRFEQETKTLAALNHPNVLTIHDAGVQDGTPFLVSELLEGQTLREQLSNGALTIRKATDYALQIVQGLAAAHSKGIIHRDLKPENIFVTKDGRVKILDFGLAKLQENFKSQISNLKSSGDEVPTLADSTQPGMVLGTPAYMSPEQVRGEPVDHRTDIFAFGCVLYEMLTGNRAFKRETAIQSMNAVLSEDPPELTSSDPNISAALERIMHRCLEKRPEQRFQTANDLAFAIENVGANSITLSGGIGHSAARNWHWKHIAPWTLTASSLAVLAWLVHARHAPSVSHSQAMRKLELTLTTPGTRLGPAALIRPVISPDGRKIAYAAPDGLWLRWLDQLAAPVVLVKGENILAPFWSPQSTDIGYFEGQNLMRVSIAEKRCTLLATLPERMNDGPAGGAWLAGDQISFTTGQPALYQVPAQGGKITTVLAGGQGERSFSRATSLPGGLGVIFLIRRPVDDEDQGMLVLWTLSGKRVVVFKTGDAKVGGLACSTTGHVLFDRWDGMRGIWAVPFSFKELQCTGDLRQISDTGSFPSVAEDGTLACAMGVAQDNAAAQRRLAWVDRSGQIGSIASKALPCLSAVRLSPDGQRAVAMAGETIDGLDIWLFDLAAGQGFAVTQTPVQEALPGWWEEGRAIYFTRFGTNGANEVIGTPTQTIGEEQRLVPDLSCWTTLTSGKLMLGRAKGKWGYVSLADRAQTFVALPRQLQQMGQPEFSPNGRQLAYRSPESGPGAVYVVDFPTFTNRSQVSYGGGFDPHWRPGSSELFFTSDDGRALMSVCQKPGSPDYQAPEKVFDLPESIDPGQPGWPAFYAVTADGQRFLMLQNSGELSSEAHVAKPNAMLIENWSPEFQKRK